MAILSKIRDRSMFLILIVGLALFAFVLDPSSIQNFFSASKVNSIGAVNGEEIDREEFARQVEAYRAQSGGRATQIQAVNTVWNTFIGEKIFKTQLEEAGIVVGEKDIWDAMVALPEIQNSPMFKNQANLFDEEKLKEYIANLKDEAEAGNPEAWYNWLNTEKSIKQNLERQAYTSLVTAGLGASLEEGKENYLFNNTSITGQFVYVPYVSIPDSIAEVTIGDIKKYVASNTKKYKPEATRSLEYVKFDIVPSLADDQAVKAVVESYINDREEYSNAAKATVKIAGLKNATNYEEFLNDNKSDLAIDNGYKYRSQVPSNISEAVFNAEIGDVIGAYKENGYYKISKLVEVLQLPDSVKSSHIIVPYAGSTRSTSLKTKEEAKKTADSIFNLVKNNKAKFIEVADEINSDGTKGKGGDIGWIRKDQAFSPGFDKDFADFIYKNRVGSIQVVETAFGFHIIKIEEQTKAEKAVKLATYARLIEASEETENNIFEQAETLAAAIAEGKSLEDVAAEKGYNLKSALNLKALDEEVPGLTSQRQIVTWAFNAERNVGDYKRFDIDVNGNRGYAVVYLSEKTSKDEVAISPEIIAEVRPLLMNEKKAELIQDKLSGSTLEEIAASGNTSVRNASSINLGSPIITGVGNEPAVVGAMSTIELEKISEMINGVKGIFFVKVTKRDLPVDIENYETFRNTIETGVKGRTYQLYQVLQETADIDDNRATFF
ncbi:peptidylprolyl isomerase/peptidyl-prolyl cis-trans isomerase D [Lutibacter agarilyticus]|uniref:Periplasmic chaperone PpiD n=1 Tax=Lutibacter agarilyticus TaxID=1109740 RepID=A0A238WK14_9FLAO|nr:peptidylprolyl isomerase [Lutibacter agarilyticus]SNR46778.1 peptidylprolyl isomerase/peptidyl-prolyl cis-trans isomerase D [Lutibacter agarilyticus]